MDPSPTAPAAPAAEPRGSGATATRTSTATATVAATAAESSTLTRLGHWLRPLVTVGLLVFAAAVVVGNILPTRGESTATERRLDAERHENERLRRRIAAKEREARLLETDPWLTERILRDEFKMSGEREVLIR